MKMTNGICAAALVLGLGLLTAGCSRDSKREDGTDVQTVRADLKEQVAGGQISTAEAQVKLARAFAEAKQREREQTKRKESARLNAVGIELKQQVEKGELTEDEAEAKWIEAKKAEAGAKSEGAKEPSR